ncbi:hypothetical protein [uncultured Pseudodesulfovibrio sp.]|uniref:hypothetical protein n=1 Tax=uncultured Pseudodesulfovibrio sp. TaxID=2035858 RepID=UPI0029C72F10|nr:hypothetical protein [uncultured Pseudodesulfovibrio sp.]
MSRLKWTAAIFAMLIGLVVITPWPSGIAETAPGNQKSCPVMGFDIDREIFADFRAKRIYFCCPSCPPEFRKSPATYMNTMQTGGVLLEDAPIKIS